MKTITLEEHYASPSFIEGPGKGLKEHAKNFTGPRANLLEQFVMLKKEESQTWMKLVLICKSCP